jgi:hypothetical protein
MARHYVTFGQEHVHSVAGRTLDKDCVAVFEANDANHGRDKAFEFFGPQFCFEYHDTDFDQDSMKFFPRGFIKLP